MTLSVLAATTILVVGLFAIVSRERQASSSFDAVEQADLAIQAGLENAGALLKEALQDENGLVMAVPSAPWITAEDVARDKDKVLEDEDGRQAPAPLMAVRREESSASLNGYAWTYTPLVSGVLGSKPQQGRTDPVLQALSQGIRPQMPGSYVGGQPTYKLTAAESDLSEEELLALKRAAQRTAATVSPWQRTTPQHWVELTISDTPQSTAAGDEVAARFAFYIEDLQGDLPLSTAGNFNQTTGLHERTPFALPSALPAGLSAREKDLLRWSNTQVPGLNLRRLDMSLLAETSLHTFFQPAVDPKPGNPDLDEVLNRMHRVLLRSRHMQFSPENWREKLLQPDPLLAWSGLQTGSLQERDATTGSLAHPAMRRLEEQGAAGLLPYDELALIPPDPAMSNLFTAALPARKLNLNRLLHDIETETEEEQRLQKNRAAVDEIAQHIQNHLPHFAGANASTSNANQAGRKGGYPLPLGGNHQQKARAYLQCLAAGIIDYADTDSLPTMDGDPLLKPEDDTGGSEAWDGHYPRYRGIDAYPVVTKQWQRYRHEGLESAEGSSYSLYSITHYIELWNMTNQVISGEVAAAYEANGYVPAGFRQYDLMECLEGGVSGATIEANGKPQKEQLPDLRRKGQKLEGWWHQPIRMDDPSAQDADQRSAPFIIRGAQQPIFKPMQPNEVRVIAFSPVVYRFNIGLSGGDGTSLDFVPVARAESPHANIGPNPHPELSSRYRVSFKPSGASGFMIVDQPLRQVDRIQRRVVYSENANAVNRQHFNFNMPGMSYANTKLSTRLYYNNLGDPRGAFFVNFHQDYINYEDGSSPWARAYRHDQKAKFFGQNRTYLWPDGGHINRGPKNSVISRSTNPDDKSLVPSWNSAKTANLAERQKFVQQLSNSGRFFSVTEIGHVFDPIMWDPNGGAEGVASGDPLNNMYREFANLRTGTNATPSDKFCGGNTLRIGRPEHERFRPDYALPPASGRPFLRSLSATALLDLFHCGQQRAGWHTNPLSPEEITQLTGDLIRIHGHVNLNTASRDTLRALVAGRLERDPRLRRKPPNKNADNEDDIAAAPSANDSVLHPPSSVYNAAQADLLAELIIRHRPYITPAELPEKVLVPTSTELLQRPYSKEMPAISNQPGIILEEGQPVFGATRRETDRLIEPEWNDAAAEEAFARVFNNATVRSRNFRVVVTGQALRRTRSGETKVLATRSRLYHIFIRPIRDPAGNLIRQQTEILYARTL